MSEKMMPSNDPLFPLGATVATPGAIEALRAAHGERWRLAAAELLTRHSRGDWCDGGLLCVDDRRANDASIRIGARILSAYDVGGAKVWIITEADRSSTCLLLPSEY